MNNPFVPGSFFDPEPGHEGLLAMTLEQLATVVRQGIYAQFAGVADREADAALAEILRRIDAATGNT